MGEPPPPKPSQGHQRLLVSSLPLQRRRSGSVQILGAEKALFRALKAKHDTPKYGLIYHASLVGQAAPKFKGKVSRVLAAKAALSTRVDALGDDLDGTLGLAMRAQVTPAATAGCVLALCVVPRGRTAAWYAVRRCARSEEAAAAVSPTPPRAGLAWAGQTTAGGADLCWRGQVETRLRQMEGRLLAVDSAKPRGQVPAPKYDPARQGASTALLTEPTSYNAAADVTMDAAATQKPKASTAAGQPDVLRPAGPGSVRRCPSTADMPPGVCRAQHRGTRHRLCLPLAVRQAPASSQYTRILPAEAQAHRGAPAGGRGRRGRGQRGRRS